MTELDCGGSDQGRRRPRAGSTGISSFSDFTCYPDRFPSRRTSFQGSPPGSSWFPAASLSTSKSASAHIEELPSPIHNNSNNNNNLNCQPLGHGSIKSNPLIGQRSFYAIMPDAEGKFAERQHLDAFQSSRVRLSSQGEVDDKALLDVKDSPAFQSQLLHKVPRRRMSSVPTSYSFFDYSMIPDKMDSSRQSLQIPK